MMKRKIVVFSVFFALLILAFRTYSQPANRPVDPVSEGDWILSIGIGPASYGPGSGPGFQLAFERGMWSVGPGAITLGGEAGFSFTSDYYKDYYRHNYFSTIFAARSGYHYGWEVRGLDTYGGFTLGFRFTSYKGKIYNDYDDPYDGPASFGPHFGAFIGASYFFSPKVGINGEFGYNINFAQIGLVFKLN